MCERRGVRPTVVANPLNLVGEQLLSGECPHVTFPGAFDALLFAVAFVEELAVLALVRPHCVRVRLALIKGEVARARFFPSNLFVTVNVANEAHVVDAVVLGKYVNLRAGESALLAVHRFEFDVGVFGQFRLTARLVRDGEGELRRRDRGRRDLLLDSFQCRCIV